MILLSFDPSGNFHEGKGTTGYATFQDRELIGFDEIKSDGFENQMQYWWEHLQVIKKIDPSLVLIESYKLFEHKAQSQSWSAMETPQLIGAMQMFCWNWGIPVDFQDPAQKQGVNDERLTKLGYFEKKSNRYYCQGRLTNLHMRDAIRHGIFYYRYGKGKQNG
jgi:hypothetical protein